MACVCGPATVETCCCSSTPTPAVLAIEFDDGTDPVGSAVLTFTGSAWTGTVDLCGETGWTLSLTCSGGFPECEWTIASDLFGSVQSVVTHCSPFELQFRELPIGGTPCSGELNATITG